MTHLFFVGKLQSKITKLPFLTFFNFLTFIKLCKFAISANTQIANKIWLFVDFIDYFTFFWKKYKKYQWYFENRIRLKSHSTFNIYSEISFFFSIFEKPSIFRSPNVDIFQKMYRLSTYWNRSNSIHADFRANSDVYNRKQTSVKFRQISIRFWFAICFGLDDGLQKALTEEYFAHNMSDSNTWRVKCLN